MTIKVNHLYQGDNLAILKDIESDFIDLIYLDPPFNTGKVFTSKGGSFNDKWTGKGTDVVFDDPALNDIIKVCGHHSPAMKSYVTFMTQRFIELHRVLKPTGSLYLHVDPTASHYLKIALDMIFGKNNYMNEIIWRRMSGSKNSKTMGRSSDTILFYVKDKNSNFVFNQQYQPHRPEYIKDFYRYKDERGSYCLDNMMGHGTNPKDERGLYRLDNMMGHGTNPNDKEWRGYNPSSKGHSWRVPQNNLRHLIEDDKVITQEQADA